MGWDWTGLVAPNPDTKLKISKYSMVYQACHIPSILKNSNFLYCVHLDHVYYSVLYHSQVRWKIIHKSNCLEVFGTKTTTQVDKLCLKNLFKLQVILVFVAGSINLPDKEIKTNFCLLKTWSLTLSAMKGGRGNGMCDLNCQ